ncbi:MAG TPA: beta-ketoacyl-ACP synthase II [Ilumatobacteraceae bacterium]|nr:beta-ketoacyl-ACP synthase II [Ilumatobacteraceae bacterium]HRB03211.1 beta-ketoacyl-ACP synthase II [Ilumatobacteraceae bacterium]
MPTPAALSPIMGDRGRRVAITGYGVVAPCGLGKQAFWAGLNGPSITTGRTVEMVDWDPTPYFANAKEARRADKVEQFALAAAAECFEQAGRPDIDSSRFGTIFATGVGGLRSTEEQIEILIEKGERRVSPFLVPMMMPNAPGAAISMRYGLQGPNETITTACAASTHAIGYAARLIAWGMIDACITGGSESAACPIAVASFGNMTALSSSGNSRPFSPDRDGFVLGEGAAVLLLEEWEAAVARGANIVGEVIGAASNADAHHITAPAPGGTGAIKCMNLALRDAGLTTVDIRQINAHGTSTPLNDAAEAAAIAAVFGPGAVPVTSTKGVTGHALGAAGALEAAAVLLSMEHSLIPPTAGTTVLDEGFEIDVVLGAARPWTPGPTMSNSLGFGGHNGSIILAPAP